MDQDVKYLYWRTGSDAIRCWTEALGPVKWSNEGLVTSICVRVSPSESLYFVLISTKYVNEEDYGYVYVHAEAA